MIEALAAVGVCLFTVALSLVMLRRWDGDGRHDSW